MSESKHHVDPEIQERVRGYEVAEALNLRHKVGIRLWREIGDVETLRETPRNELEEVKGVGPATAERINPPRTRLARAVDRAVDGGLYPRAPPKDGKERAALSHTPQVRIGLELAVRDAYSLTDELVREA